MIIPPFGFSIPLPPALEDEQAALPVPTLNEFSRMIAQLTSVTIADAPSVTRAVIEDEHAAEPSPDNTPLSAWPFDLMQKQQHRSPQTLADEVEASQKTLTQPHPLDAPAGDSATQRTDFMMATLSTATFTHATSANDNAAAHFVPQLLPHRSQGPAPDSLSGVAEPPAVMPVQELPSIVVTSHKATNKLPTPRIAPPPQVIALEHSNMPHSPPHVAIPNHLPMVQQALEQPITSLVLSSSAPPSTTPPQIFALQALQNVIPFEITIRPKPFGQHDDVAPRLTQRPEISPPDLVLPPPKKVAQTHPLARETAITLTLFEAAEPVAMPFDLEQPAAPPETYRTTPAAPPPLLPNEASVAPLTNQPGPQLPAPTELQETVTLLSDTGTRPFDIQRPLMTTIGVPQTPLVQLPERILEQHRAGQPRIIEITLAPPELGQLRLHMQPAGDHIQIVLSAEQGSTLELMRRNAEWLSNSLKELGFSSNSFSFTSWSGSENHNLAKGQDRAPLPAPQQHGSQRSAEQDQTYLATTAHTSQPNSGLDLRL